MKRPAYRIRQNDTDILLVSDRYAAQPKDKKLLMLKMIEEWVDYQKRLLGVYETEPYYLEKLQNR